MENRAIVIMYHGEEASEYVLTHIVESLIGSGVVNRSISPEAYRMNASDIAKTIAQHTYTPSDENETDLAAIYIGEKFKDSLSTSNNIKFAVDLTAALNNGDERLKNAIFILSQPKAKLSKKVVTEYHIGPSVLTAIRNAYSYV